MFRAEENEAFTKEYLGYVGELGGDEAGRRRAWELMGHGSAFYRGLPCAFSYVPRLFGPSTRKLFEDISRTTYGILAKILKEYRDNPAYRSEFRFDPRVEDLVLLPCSHAEPLPVARIDFVFDELAGGFHFVEFNTDSSSGMNETREALAAIAETEPYRRFVAAHEVESDVRRQFEGWVESFVHMWRESAASAKVALCGETEAVEGRCFPEAGVGGNGGRKPQLAIVACLDSPNPEIGELSAYRQMFELAGVACSVFDVRQLEFDGERLVGRTALDGPSDVAIDCVWRFCIVVDLLEHWEDVQPLIRAVRQGKVDMIGGFSTQIVHDKQLFAVLRRPATQALLTADERDFVREHVPATYFLDDPSLDLSQVKAHPEKWVVKPTDWYASKNVIAGPDCTPAEWARAIDERVAQKTHQGVSPFIVQEFFAPHRTPVIALYGNDQDFVAEPQDFGNLMGVFLHAGKFGGAYVRQGPYNVIGSARAGLVAPVLWV